MYKVRRIASSVERAEERAVISKEALLCCKHFECYRTAGEIFLAWANTDFMEAELCNVESIVIESMKHGERIYYSQKEKR